MNIDNITLSIKIGETATIKMPNGHSVEVGYCGNGQVPANKGWVIISNGQNERAFSVEPDCGVQEYISE